jgi:hypothetical protein
VQVFFTANDTGSLIEDGDSVPSVHGLSNGTLTCKKMALFTRRDQSCHCSRMHAKIGILSLLAVFSFEIFGGNIPVALSLLFDKIYPIMN